MLTQASGNLDVNWLAPQVGCAQTRGRLIVHSDGHRRRVPEPLQQRVRELQPPGRRMLAEVRAVRIVDAEPQLPALTSGRVDPGVQGRDVLVHADERHFTRYRGE